MGWKNTWWEDRQDECATQLHPEERIAEHVPRHHVAVQQLRKGVGTGADLHVEELRRQRPQAAPHCCAHRVNDRRRRLRHRRDQGLSVRTPRNAAGSQATAQTHEPTWMSMGPASRCGDRAGHQHHSRTADRRVSFRKRAFPLTCSLNFFISEGSTMLTYSYSAARLLIICGSMRTSLSVGPQRGCQMSTTQSIATAVLHASVQLKHDLCTLHAARVRPAAPTCVSTVEVQLASYCALDRHRLLMRRTPCCCRR